MNKAFFPEKESIVREEGEKMIFINQNDYDDMPYPTNLKMPNSVLATKGTMSIAGCGICCVSMMIEALTFDHLPLEKGIEYAMASKANWEPGTDMRLLGAYTAKKHALDYKVTDNIEEALEHLREGGHVIANVSGDKEGYIGVYSDVGHYLLLLSVKDHMLTVLDSSLKPEKFEKEGRKGKVTIKGNYTLCHKDIMVAETLHKSPRYHLFNRK